MTKPLEREFEFYRRNRDVLAEKHDGKFITIKGEKVMGVFDSHREAFDSVYPEHKRGTVCIQPVRKKEREYVVGSPLVRF